MERAKGMIDIRIVVRALPLLGMRAIRKGLD
jgi:hypothetical protein